MIKHKSILDIVYTDKNNCSYSYYSYPKDYKLWSSIFLSIKNIVIKTDKVYYRRKGLAKYRIINDFIFTQLYCHSQELTTIDLNTFKSLKEVGNKVKYENNYNLQTTLCYVVNKNSYKKLKSIINITKKDKVIKVKETMPNDRLLIINVPNCNKAGLLTINKKNKGFNFYLYAPDTIYNIKF